MRLMSFRKRAFKILGAMSPWERYMLLSLSALFALSFIGLLRLFYVQNTVFVPKRGGTYIEGSVGIPGPLNPWLTVQNDVNRDIVSLVFAGLLKYDPTTKKIEDDLATMEVSPDGKTYTLRLKENLFWQDATKDDPHPVAADDVVFTYRTIQQPDFPNLLLQQNFRGVTIDKVDDRTVRFKLAEAYSFFPSNLTLGLLPERSFQNVNLANLDQLVSLSESPVGAGPYKIKTVVETDLSTEVTLERFQRTIPPPYQLDRIVFRIFPDYPTLLSDLHNLDGIRLVPHGERGEASIPKRFVGVSYTLPQYVALFFNLDRPALQDQKLRLGLQLGTNKQAIIDRIHEQKIVDTPLLEINQSDWHYHFDAESAQGALYTSRWFVPERLRLQDLLEMKEANDVGVLHMPPVVYLSTGAVLTLSGSYANGIERGSTLNGIRLSDHPTNTGAWVVAIPTRHGTGSLKAGQNLLRLTAPNGKIVDSLYVYRAPDAETYGRALEEQQLVGLFLRSKDPQLPASDRMTTQSMYLDRSFLRRRGSNDPVSIRRNEKGQLLTLRLLTSSAPAAYSDVAQMIKNQWLQLGVQVEIDIPASRDAFQDKLQRRDYDVLLFGQSLLDNLDSYPYWHSSGKQKASGNAKDLRSDAYNLSQYSSFKADTLLETIRTTSKEDERQKALKGLQEQLKNDVPAVFLYSPLYTFAYHRRILGVELGSLSLHSDRFLTLQKWYVKEQRIFTEGKSWWSFVGWVPSLL